MKVDHTLKTEQPWFDLVVEGVKNFEIRKNDRDYKEGDILELLEYDQQTKQFTDDYVIAKVELVCEFAQKEGWVVMGIKVLSVSLSGTKNWAQS
jgi:hypothetical protein